jgi:HNH endonuclease
MDLTERFMEKVFPVPEAGCWIWDAYTMKNGYGLGCLNGKRQLAHRVSYQLFKGPIPDGQNVLHRCDVRSCVNPTHLFAGTLSDNTQDMIRKGRDRSIGFHHRGKTHCKNGHEFTPENTRVRKDGYGGRRCIICFEASHKKWMEKDPVRFHLGAAARTRKHYAKLKGGKVRSYKRSVQ